MTDKTDKELAEEFAERAAAKADALSRLQELINAKPFVPFSFVSKFGDVVHVNHRAEILGMTGDCDISMHGRDGGFALREYAECRAYEPEPIVFDDDVNERPRSRPVIPQDETAEKAVTRATKKANALFRLRDLINAEPFVPFAFVESPCGEVVWVLNRDAIVEYNALGDIGLRDGTTIRRYFCCRPYDPPSRPPTVVDDVVLDVNVPE